MSAVRKTIEVSYDLRVLFTDHVFDTANLTLKQTLAGYRGGRATVILHGYHNRAAQADLELGEAWRVNAIPDLLRALRGLSWVEAAKIKIVKSEA